MSKRFLPNIKLRGKLSMKVNDKFVQNKQLVNT